MVARRRGWLWTMLLISLAAASALLLWSDARAAAEAAALATSKEWPEDQLQVSSDKHEVSVEPPEELLERLAPKSDEGDDDDDELDASDSSLHMRWKRPTASAERELLALRRVRKKRRQLAELKQRRMRMLGAPKYPPPLPPFHPSQRAERWLLENAVLPKEERIQRAKFRKSDEDEDEDDGFRPVLRAHRMKKKKRREEEDEGADVITLDDVPANGRGVDTREFRTVVNKIVVGEGDGDEDEDDEEDEGRSVVVGTVLAADRRVAQGDGGTYAVGGGSSYPAWRGRTYSGGLSAEVGPGGRMYDRRPWRPIKASKPEYFRHAKEKEAGGGGHFKKPEYDKYPLKPYNPKSAAYKHKAKKTKNSHRHHLKARELAAEEELEDIPVVHEVIEEEEEEDVETIGTRPSRHKRTNGYGIPPPPSPPRRPKRPPPPPPPLQSRTLDREARHNLGYDPDDPPLHVIDEGFFDSGRPTFQQDNAVENRYHEQPLQGGLRAVSSAGEGDYDEYSDYVEEPDEDEGVPPPPSHIVRHHPPIYRPPAGGGGGGPFRPHNHFRGAPPLPPHLGKPPRRPALSPPPSPYHHASFPRPHGSGPPFRSQSPPPPPPPVYPGHSRPAFRAPNPYYKTTPRPLYGNSYEEEEDDDDKSINFYDEVVETSEEEEDARGGGGYYKYGGDSRQPPNLRGHRGRGGSERPGPGPHYESFRVPAPTVGVGGLRQQQQHKFREEDLGYESNEDDTDSDEELNRNNPDHESFKELHNQYFTRGRGNDGNQQEEEEPSYEGRYRDPEEVYPSGAGPHGGHHHGEEDEEEDNADLAPVSEYREEYKPVNYPPEEEEEDDGRHRHHREEEEDRRRPQYGDYQDAGEEDEMGQQRGSDGQPQYAEEQDYQAVDEDPRDFPRDYRLREKEVEADYDVEDRGEEEEEEEEHPQRYHRHHRYRRPPPPRDYDDYYDDDDVEDGGRGFQPIASRDDGQWDDYFDGQRKDMDYEIGGMIDTDESYGPDAGDAADNSGKQPAQQEEGDGRRGGGGGGRDYEEGEEEEEEEDRPRYRSSDGDDEDRRWRKRRRQPTGRSDDDDDQGEGEAESRESGDYDTYMELQKKEREMEKELEEDVDKRFNDLYRGSGGPAADDSRPYSMTLQAVHRPRQYRTRNPFGRSRGRPGGFFNDPGHDTSDIPGFDDFFSKIENAVEREISRSPFQDGSADGESTWAAPSYDGDADDAPADGVVDNSGDLTPTVYGRDAGPDQLGFAMPSHAELEENYQTVTTAESGAAPVIAAAPDDFESKKL